MKKIHLDKEKLRKLYYDDNLTLVDMASIFNCTWHTISKNMEEYGFKKRPYKKEVNIPKEKLYDLYITQDKNLKEIADIFNFAESTIYKLLVKYNLIKRQKIEIPKDIIYDLYWNKDWLVKDIANKFECSSYAIRYKMKKYNIKFKDKIKLRVSKEDIYRFYIIEGKTTCEIGEMLGFSGVTVGKLLKKYKIKLRKSEDNFKHMRFVGKNNFNYIDGRSPLYETIRKSNNSKLWRTQVFERDDYTCQECGQRGGDLEAHHNIKPFSSIFSDFLKFYNNFSPLEEREILLRLSDNYEPFWNINNGITLCRNCHCNTFKNTIEKIKRGDK
jgi:predicted DNA-binding protein YlxM (UPF0122 family)/ssDNA-binding Zn-finger/Zn-ribbon topoisomerase 1